ncbi:MAG: hypothetical protein GXO79_08285 [Chlorobi bacterium]|nr:hypothetical protein [Chlorobiota bacterium]
MDKNWESILYIVISAIIIIASALKKKKKPTQNITGSSEQKKPFNFMDVLQSGISNMVENTPEPTTEYEEKVEIETKKTEPVFIEGEDVIPDKTPIKDFDIILNEEDAGIEFDLKNAIIYSEIINRKQF